MKYLLELQKDFINLRFGTFIHFNSATAQFHNNPDVDDWEFDHENNNKPRQFPFDPKTWNPEKLDCKQWAKAAKNAGCQFAALTTKHHEGFALWPTAYSEHSVKNAACTKDVVAEYLSAFREAGIVAGLYFSIMDLTAEIGRDRCSAAQKALIKGEITELLTNYGEIPFLIVDGWNAPWGGPSYELLPFAELDAVVKSLQPNCLLMNIGCSDGVEGTDIVFFENAAGQEAEHTFMGPGASCNKLTAGWFWRDKDPESTLMSAAWALEKMKTYFPMNVAFMLNLSPNTQGLVDENLVNEFEKIGKEFSMPDMLQEIPEGWLKRKK